HCKCKIPVHVKMFWCTESRSTGPIGDCDHTRQPFPDPQLSVPLYVQEIGKAFAMRVISCGWPARVIFSRTLHVDQVDGSAARGCSHSSYLDRMSRGFVKEDDQEEAPFIPPRAPLPQGAINYVTPRGLQQLQQEKQKLENDRRDVIEKAAGRSNDSDRRRELAVINGQLDQLNERIASAQVVPPL